GYVRGRNGEVHLAEVAFREMHAAMTPAQQCAWDDVRDLLPTSERNAYTGLSCNARVSATATLWWLADPLFRVAGNERQVEQESRRVEILLHSTLDQDERYSWNDKFGGDALRTLVQRYGWPGYTAWGGEYIDDDHTDYLEVRKAPRASPYTTFEYSIDRAQLLPSWGAVASPFTAPETSWILTNVRTWRRVPQLQCRDVAHRRADGTKRGVAKFARRSHIRSCIRSHIRPILLILTTPTPWPKPRPNRPR
ncbi:MAG: hypothetical protein ABI120_02275, partial [Gemmatimonadaceae bacterium]